MLTPPVSARVSVRLDLGVRSWEDQPLVSVVEAHDVRRLAARPAYLDDLARLVLLAHDPFEGAVISGGRFVLPDAPGLGVRPRPAPSA